jgi:hypothetical protein
MSINPQPYKDGYISIMRNLFLTSSIGMAMIGSSNNFTKYKKYILIASVLVILYSITYGIIASINSYEYINIIKKEKNISKLNQAVLKNWDKWIKLSYIYIVLILIISIIVFLRKVY